MKLGDGRPSLKNSLSHARNDPSVRGGHFYTFALFDPWAVVATKEGEGRNGKTHPPFLSLSLVRPLMAKRRAPLVPQEQETSHRGNRW